MTLPFLGQGGEPPGRCSELSWSPALLWGKLLSSDPNRHKYSCSVAPEWKIKCVGTLCSPLGNSAVGRAGPPARHWLSTNCGKDSREGRAPAPGLAVHGCMLASCPHLGGHFFFALALRVYLGFCGCSTTGALGLHTSYEGGSPTPQGAHCLRMCAFMQLRDEQLL